MRQLQRMQTGMALVALLFCLTSTTTWARQTQATSAGRRLQTFGGSNPGALDRTDRIAIYPTEGQHLGDPWTIDRFPTQSVGERAVFSGVATAINRAELSDKHPIQTAYSILFFRHGDLARFLAVTPTGIIYDPASNQWYQMQTEGLAQLTSRWQKRSTTE